MSAALPELVDAWRMVAARRCFTGVLPLSKLSRLCDSLAAVEGEVRFGLEFDRDAYGAAYLHVRAETRLPLICQRTLERFDAPVAIDVRLGLIAREVDEAALPPGYEPLLTPNGELRLADVIEDELILALPLVPVKEGAVAAIADDWQELEDELDEETQPRPFAALERLKKH